MNLGIFLFIRAPVHGYWIIRLNLMYVRAETHEHVMLKLKFM